MITPEEAWRRIAAELEPLAVENVSRGAAHERSLGADLAATVDVPAADVSAMDGYALAAVNETSRPVDVVGTIAAGDAPGFDLGAGQAVRIMTGATVPRAADRVVPIEDTDGGAETVVLRDLPRAGAHIRRQGEILRSGAPLLANMTHATTRDAVANAAAGSRMSVAYVMRVPSNGLTERG